MLRSSFKQLFSKTNKLQFSTINNAVALSTILPKRNFFSSFKSSNNSEENYDDRVSIKIENEIAIVTLSRPSKMNSLDMKMFKAIAHAATVLKNEKGVRCAILRGDGKAFCTGLDIKSVLQDPVNTSTLLSKPAGTQMTNLAQDVGYLWRLVPFPVVACLHGMCFGGGLQVALGCDFRYSTADCQVSVMEAKWGLIPDMGASIALRELMSIDKAKELLMTGKILTGSEAEKYNIVTKISEDPFEDALKFAEEIKSRSPDAVLGSKILLQSSWLSHNRTALDLETDLQKKIIGGWNQLAAVSAQMGKSKAPKMAYKNPNQELKDCLE